MNSVEAHGTAGEQVWAAAHACMHACHQCASIIHSMSQAGKFDTSPVWLQSPAQAASSGIGHVHCNSVHAYMQRYLFLWLFCAAKKRFCSDHNPGGLYCTPAAVKWCTSMPQTCVPSLEHSGYGAAMPTHMSCMCRCNACTPKLGAFLGLVP